MAVNMLKIIICTVDSRYLECADRRVSVWSADWSKDFCELVDWLTFPAPAFTPDGTVIAKQDQKVLNSSLKGETPYYINICDWCSFVI
jgi:hypothetical protein